MKITFNYKTTTKTMIDNPKTKAQFFFKNFRNIIVNELKRRIG